jgi:hypothetical protein
MDAHLNSKQIAQLVAGDIDSQAKLHARDCEQCRASVAQLQNTVHGFAAAARAAAQRSPVDWTRQRNAILGRTHARALRPRAWAMAATFAVFLLAGLLLLVSPKPNQPQVAVKPPAPQATVDEDVLLAQVNDEVERDTPEALAPVELLLQDRAQVLNTSSGTGTKRVSRGGSND